MGQAVNEGWLAPLNEWVPEFSLICLEDQDWYVVANPPLTSVEQPSYAMGAKAMEALLQRIDGSVEPSLTYRLETRLLIRESTAAPSSTFGGDHSQEPLSTLVT